MRNQHGMDWEASSNNPDDFISGWRPGRFYISLLDTSFHKNFDKLSHQPIVSKENN